MKKTLLFGGLLFTAVFSNAQRLSLYEEFSGENCGPCAATNPGLMTLLDANPTKVLLIKYQTPIPSAGPIYNENTADVNSRTTYYNVPFAPYGRLDGDVSPGAPSGSGNDGHPGYLTQAHLDAAAAVPTNFTFTVTNAITSGTNIVTTVNITSSAAYTNANLKLRVALVEDLSFTTPPGTNGEMVFHHVMRKMLANPINVQSTWTAGGTQSLSTTSVAIPSYVDRTHNVFVIAWIQDETTKKVLQAGKSAVVPPAALDGTVISTTPANGALLCGVTTVPHKVKIQNTGTTAISGSITSTQGATVIGTQTFTNIAPGAFSAELTMGNATPSGGVVTIQDVVTLTGGTDQNPINNTVVTSAAALTTGGLPQTTSFESATLPAGYLVLDNDEKIVANPPFDGPVWFTHTEAGITAQNGTFTAITDCAGIDPGNTTIITFPYVAAPTGAKAVDFYYAYAQRGTIAGDKLEVVYSTDCGQNWTSLWSKSGADLATAPATGSQSLFLPTSASQYKFASVDASTANGDVIMGFRATSGGGNLMYIDNVNYRTGAPTVGIEEIVAGGNFSVYPNPTTGVLNIELTMVKKSDVTISVYNVLGQQVNAPVTQSMGVGTNTTTINTSNLAAGMYYLNIATEAGNIQQKFTKQ